MDREAARYLYSTNLHSYGLGCEKLPEKTHAEVCPRAARSL